MTHPEPPDLRGPFADLMSEIRACKECGKCPDLQIRALYFEPNPSTIGEWRKPPDEIQAYSDLIDRRVMFICESPGGQIKDYGNIEPRRCWSVTPQDHRFYKMRKEQGFQDCYLTNSVKCGVRRDDRHTDAEMDRCGKFLTRELELVKPMVAVGVGDNAMLALRRAVRKMKDPPVLFQITHYSARRGWPEREWPHEMAELKRLLTRLRPRSEWNVR